MLDVLISEKEFSETNYKRLEKSLVYKTNSINFGRYVFNSFLIKKYIN